MRIFGDKYNDTIELSLNIETFIKESNVKKICIPIFIAHGTESEIKNIFNELIKIKRSDILGLNTIYIVISLPIVNKSKMIGIFTKK